VWPREADISFLIFNYMAQRRMFSQKIVGSDSFLEMPVSARELYFQLGMYADDDGFINPRKIIRMIGASEDDLKVLKVKRFVLNFENGVVVIKHWLINNLIRKDFYQQTLYTEQKKQLIIKENKSYTECKQNVNNLLTQDRIGKDRLYNNIAANAAKNSFNSINETINGIKKWQDLALQIIAEIPDAEGKKSSVFKCCKKNEHKARIAFNDCKELEKPYVMYFLKVFNELTKQNAPKNISS
jgi:hypothetical protein